MFPAAMIRPHGSIGLTYQGPSVTASRRYPAASVIHIRFAVHPSSPWRGVSPLAWATSTGKLGAFLETRLGEESSGPVGYLLSVPSEGRDENLEGSEIRSGEPGRRRLHCRNDGSRVG